MMTIEQAIDKARKLFALAQSDNPHEAAQAAARAQELLARYSIDAAMLDVGADEPPEEEIKGFNDPLDVSRKWASWKLILANSIARHNQTKVYTSGSRLMLVGCPSDAAKVRYLYAWLTNEVERLARVHTPGEGRTYANNFRLGVVSAIDDKLDEANRKARQEVIDAAPAGAALVRVNTAIERVQKRGAAVELWAKQKLGLRPRAGSNYRGDHDAYTHGKHEGSKLNVGGSARGALGAGQRALS